MTRDENSSRPDAELARLAADGDAAAFDEIYSRHRGFVYSLAVRMTGNQADAQDLTWARVAAFACFAGSILSLVLGFAFTTDGLLSAAPHPFLHAVGCTLLIIGIPILILGGHCLDLMEKKNTKSRRELHTKGDVAGSLSAELQLCAALPLHDLH